jgi:hypothetical protein
MEICENCYEEANLVRCNGMAICKDCVSEFTSNTSYEGESEYALLDEGDVYGVMSDDDVLDMIRDEYVGY